MPRDLLDILADCSDWVAVMKPAGLATIPGRGEDDSVLERLTQTADSPAVRRRYGDALASAGREADALQQYRQALKLDPRHYPAMNSMASLLITQYRTGLLLDDRKRDEALAMWKQSLQLNPDQPKVEAQIKQWQPKAG